MRRFEGKVVLVTGAARPPGMGRATALRLAREGADIVCVDRVVSDPAGATDGAAPETVEEVQASLRAEGARSIAIDADVSSSLAFGAALGHALEAFGRIDVCCCLSGISGAGGGLGDLIELTDESWGRCLDVNLTAPFTVSSAVARHMIDRGGGGAITLLSSYASLVPPAGAGAIGIARAGVNFLVQVLASELGPHGIRVNAVCPLGVGATDGPLRNSGLDELIERVTGGSQADWARSVIPLGRLQSADETAAVVAYLSSDDASFVSGQSVSVAGGAPG